MAKVTSKLQVTVPKTIAEQYGTRPGDDIEWIPAGDAVRVRKATPQDRKAGATTKRLELFDQATQRQKACQRKRKKKATRARDRGWRREDLYDRGGSR